MTEEKVFRRAASGLVRQVGIFDNFLYNLYSANIGSLIGFSFPLIWAIYPGGDIATGIFIDFLILIPIMVYYWLLTVYMPRTAAPYTFESRALHPAPAFITNWNWALVNAIWNGLTATWVVTIGLSPLLIGLGLVTGNSAFFDLSATVSQPVWIFNIAVITLLICALLTVLGLRTFKLLSALSLIALFGVVLSTILLAVTPQQTFISAFNNIMRGYTKAPNPYQEVIQIAANEGFQSIPFDWLNTFQVHFMVWGWTAACIWSAHHAGEIKDVKKNNLVGFFGAGGITCLIAALYGFFVNHAVGYDFLVAMSSLATFAPDKLALPGIASGSLYPAIISGNVAIAFLIGISFALWAFLWVFIQGFMPTRCMFGWAFDRLFPDTFAKISKRFRTPVNAIILTYAISIVAVYLFVFTNIMAAMTIIYGLYFISIVSGLAAMVFPWRRKDIYEASPAKYKILGIPLISIAGFLIFVTTAVTLYAYVFVPKVAFLDWPSMPSVIAIWLSGLIVYLVARWYNIRKGIPFDLQFKQPPPA